MVRVIGSVAAAVLLAGCASAPSISELHQGVRTVAFVQNGVTPLDYSTGVIDTSSFWAAYGSGVSSNLGGSPLFDSAQASGQADKDAKVNQNHEMVKRLYGNHEMAKHVNAELLPPLADAWGVQYREADVVVLTDKPAFIDAKTGLLQGFDTQADLILMTQVEKVNLTERFSMGSALASGFTMGMNKKSLTTEVTVGMRVFKRDPQAGGLKQVWQTACGPNYTTMDTSYYLDELAQAPDKMAEILNEAEAQAIDSCTQALRSIKSTNMTASSR